MEENRDEISYDRANGNELVKILTKKLMEKFKVEKDQNKTVIDELIMQSQEHFPEIIVQEFVEKLKKENPELTVEKDSDKIGEMFEMYQEERLDQEYVDSMAKLEQAGLETANFSSNPTDEEKYAIIQRAEEILKRTENNKNDIGEERG